MKGPSVSNHLAVLLATAGLFAAIYGLFGLGPAAVVAGLHLLVAAWALLIDVPTGRS